NRRGSHGDPGGQNDAEERKHRRRADHAERDEDAVGQLELEQRERERKRDEDEDQRERRGPESMENAARFLEPEERDGEKRSEPCRPVQDERSEQLAPRGLFAVRRNEHHWIG